MSTRTGALYHHFEDIEQQRGAERLGMWMFLATEILFFGGVFFAYTVYRLYYPADFAAISSQLNVLVAGINTLLLLTSSLTMTLAIRAAQLGNNGALKFHLLASAILGLAFMGFKAYEYNQDYHEKLLPWKHDFGTEVLHGHDKPQLEVWKDEGIEEQRVRLFMTFYFCMTGIHGVHLLVGIGVILYLFVRAMRGTITPEKYVSVEVTSLYWHLVDAIWLFLMPLLYLAGPHEHLHF